MIAAPLVVATLAYYFFKKYKVPAKKPLPDTNGFLAEPVLTANNGGIVPADFFTGQTNSSGCTFPLKKGSNNPCVGQLQAALGGLVIDNDFGSKTLAALQAAFGVSEVKDATDLSNKINSLKNANNSLSNLSGSQKLLEEYKTRPGLKYIKCLGSTAWIGVISNGSTTSYAWKSDGYQLNVHEGLLMSLADYKLMTVDQVTGNVIINCNKGGNQGYWSVPSNKISLV